MFIIWIFIIWSFLGVVYITMKENCDTSDISTKKAVWLICASGPVVWVYTLYRWLR